MKKKPKNRRKKKEDDDDISFLDSVIYKNAKQCVELERSNEELADKVVELYKKRTV